MYILLKLVFSLTAGLLGLIIGLHSLSGFNTIFFQAKTS